MSYKDIIPQLGLPDELNKRLEKLLSMEKDKEEKQEGTFGPGLKELKAARKQFRKSYRKIRKLSPSKKVNEGKKSDSEDDLNRSLSSSSYDSSDGEFEPDKILKRLPGVLTHGQKTELDKEDRHLKYLENKYLQKEKEFEKALKDLEEDDKIDEELLKSMTKDLDTEGYDLEAENEELDRIINELKEMTKEMPEDRGALDRIAD